MTSRELRKESRAGLLEILLAQSSEIDRLKAEVASLNEKLEEKELIDRLKAEVASLNEKLEEKELIMSRSGSIAEASLELNRVFEAAQLAADQYVRSIRMRYSE